MKYQTKTFGTFFLPKNQETGGIHE